MALSCFLSRLSSSHSLLRAPTLKSVTTKYLKTSAVFGNNGIHQNLFFKQDQNQKLISQCNIAAQPIAVSALAKQFSTTSIRLGDHKDHNHVNIWRLERLLSVALVPLVPAALIAPSQTLDTLCAIIIVMHTHWGLEAIVVDYIRPILFGELAPKIGLGLLYLFSIVTLAGLMNLIYNDSGLANAFLQLWKL